VNIDQELQKLFNFLLKLVKNSRDNLSVDGHKDLPVARSTGHVQIRRVTYCPTPSACCLSMCIVTHMADTAGAQLFVRSSGTGHAAREDGGYVTTVFF
jgi:hypothetical protein